PSLSRPDVVRRVLEAGSVAKALELADKAANKSTKLLEVEQVLPPKVAITSPAKNGLWVQQPAITVKAAAHSTGQHPVTSLQLLLAGRPYEGRRGLRSLPGGKTGTTEKEWAVELPPGTHRLAVVAKSAVSSSTSDAVEITYTPAAKP